MQLEDVVTLEGVVTTGMGRGAYYIGLDVYQERFHDVLGFYPYAGTLNLEVDPDQRQALADTAATTHIDAPVHDGEELSAVDVHRVTVGGVDAGLLDLAITDHPDSIAEIVAPVNLRNQLDLADGDTVVCRPQH